MIEETDSKKSKNSLTLENIASNVLGAGLGCGTAECFYYPYLTPLVIVGACVATSAIGGIIHSANEFLDTTEPSYVGSEQHYLGPHYEERSSSERKNKNIPDEVISETKIPSALKIGAGCFCGLAMPPFLALVWGVGGAIPGAIIDAALGLDMDYNKISFVNTLGGLGALIGFGVGLHYNINEGLSYIKSRKNFLKNIAISAITASILTCGANEILERNQKQIPPQKSLEIIADANFSESSSTNVYSAKEI